MRLRKLHLICAIIASAAAVCATGQSFTSASGKIGDPLPLPTDVIPSGPEQNFAAAPGAHTVQQMLDSAASGVKFDLRDLMEILRDRRHEGWVLAAYPDPKTARPLIGAGLSLDLPAREHPQIDPLNPHPFVEPSSADMWQAAGLDPARLQSILGQFEDQMAAWTTRGFRKRIFSLEPQITDEEATALLRVFALQAVYNARGYCRDFDRLTGPQQMALTQLVYQMGVNLQEFTSFLDQINNYSGESLNGSAHSASMMATDGAYWKSVQQSLIQSQWARLYRVRAIAVIAMLDPHYDDSPQSAERRVSAILHPPVSRRRQPAARLERVSSKRPSSSARASSTSRKGKLQQQRKQG